LTRQETVTGKNKPLMKHQNQFVAIRCNERPIRCRISVNRADFPQRIRARAVRMLLEHARDHSSQREAIYSIAAKIGCTRCENGYGGRNKIRPSPKRGSTPRWAAWARFMTTPMGCNQPRGKSNSGIGTEGRIKKDICQGLYPLKVGRFRRLPYDGVPRGYDIPLLSIDATARSRRSIEQARASDSSAPGSALE